MKRIELPSRRNLRMAGFHYDPDTGKLFRKGKLCESKTQRYRNVWIGSRKEGRLYVQHRIAWVLMTGKPPKEEIDHINRDGFDNRWCNLREADRSLNCVNQVTRRDNKLGRGIHFCNKTGMYVVQIQRNKKRSFHKFETLELATEWRDFLLEEWDGNC